MSRVHPPRSDHVLPLRLLPATAVALFAVLISRAAAQHSLPLDPSKTGMGHPVFTEEPPPVPFGGDTPVPEPFLVSGNFVNFESPPVKPLALSSNGATLFLTNTPNNRLVVMNTTGPAALNIVKEIPVGLDPVAVAVQPGTGDNIVWVANMISDDVSVVDVAAGRVIKVIEVGDEPVNIVFNDTGTHAFVVLQGSPIPAAGEPLVREGALVAIDTTTRSIVNKVFLDSHTPRAAVFARGLVVVAALHSGNNTSVAGQPIRYNSQNPDGTITSAIAPLLLLPQLFSLTANVFTNPDLSPWPDPPTAITNPSPLVLRIVQDAAGSGSWQQIVNLLDANHDGQPDPAVLAQFQQEFPTILNAAQVLTETINDVKDTVDHDLIVIDASNPVAGLPISTTVSNVGGTLPGMAYNSPANLLFVSNMQPRNLTRLEANLRGHVVDHQVVVVNGPGQFISPVDLHAGVPGFNDVSTPNPAAQIAALANPTDIVFSADGMRAFVAALGSSRVGMLNGVSAAVLGRVDVGRGPRGLALDSQANKLYCFNRTDMSISVIDVSTNQMQVTQTLALFNPEPAAIRDGRDFLFSTRFSNNYATSCAICHVDATLDHRAWDLGDPAGTLQPGPPNLANQSNHPVKGPMVTLSLVGLDRHEPFHWRSDRPTFQDFNGAFDHLLGGSQLPAQDMNAYTTFVKTINYPPNPYRNRDNTFKDAAAINGQTLYVGPASGGGCVNCNTCHQIADDGAMKVTGVLEDTGMDLSGLFAQLQEVPQLRDIHKKFNTDLYGGVGLLHDGREEREGNGHPLQTFLLTFFPGLSAQQRQEMVAFVGSPGTELEFAL